jgi:hypothetical protein
MSSQPAPGLLWLFGERGHAGFALRFGAKRGYWVNTRGLTLEETIALERIKRLFPEAEIETCAN